MPKSKEDRIVYTCCACGGDVRYATPAKFYKTNSKMYANHGYMPICREHLDKIFDEYVTDYADRRLALKRICMAFDLYYSDSIYDACSKGKELTVGHYIRTLNMRQYKDKTFDTSLKENFVFGTVPNGATKGDPDAITPEDEVKWGVGFSGADYAVLNDHYKFLMDANPNCDNNQEIFIGDLCYFKMLQMRALKKGDVDSFNKLSESYRKTFQQTGLKTVRDNGTSEEFTIGVNEEIIEKYTPAEYYKDKELYKDFDGIGGYIERFMLRPLRNLMHGTTDRDYEYFVKSEDGDSDDYAD